MKRYEYTLKVKVQVKVKDNGQVEITKLGGYYGRRMATPVRSVKTVGIISLDATGLNFVPLPQEVR